MSEISKCDFNHPHFICSRDAAFDDICSPIWTNISRKCMGTDKCILRGWCRTASMTSSLCYWHEVTIPYQSEKFAASLPQTCCKLAAHYLVRQRNLETVCRSVRLVAHFWRTTDCAPQRARLCARTGIVCEKCATIYSYSKQALIVCQKCARGFSLYFYSVKVSRVCDKVCQNSMMIFLFIYVYLKCV